MLSHDACVSILCGHGADIMLTTNEGMTALMMCTYGQHELAVQKLLEHGDWLWKEHRLDTSKYARLDVSCPNNYGVTALMFAVITENVFIVTLICDHHAVLDTQNAYGITALMLAAAKGNVKILEILLHRGANVSLSEKQGQTALMVII